MKHFRPELWSLIAVAFLAPVIGGHVSSQAQPLYGSVGTEILGGSGLPLGTRLLFALFICGGLFLAIYRNRVVQVPNVRTAAVLALLLGLTLVSVLSSRFPYAGFREWMSLLLFTGVMFLAVTACGRMRGTWAALTSLALGCGLVAGRGILEYASRMAEEPAYRVFAGWNNPNAAATVLAVGAVLTTGLALAHKRGAPLFLGLATLDLVGLGLTQSKGGILAACVGILFLVIANLTSSGKPARALLALVPVVLGIGLLLGLTKMAVAASNGGSALARVTTAGTSAEQSVGFRRNLWESAAALIQQNPAGTGLGTFRYYSAKPGIVDQTEFAHQAYLQLAAESGILALAAYLGLGGYWTLVLLRGTRSQPTQHRQYKFAVVAAVVAFAAHGFVESNLSFLGSLLVLGILLGTGFQLAADSTAPEALPPAPRFTVLALLCAVPLVGCALFAASEVKKASLMTALANKDALAAKEIAPTLAAGTYGDPEAAYLQALHGAASAEDRASQLTAVAERWPVAKVYRAAASALLANGAQQEAADLARQVFVLDPNNLYGWTLYVEILESFDHDAASAAARDALKVESSRSYTTRAIPEVVPTELLGIRLFLAENEQSNQAKSKLLEPAVEGYNEWATVTKPYLERFIKAGVVMGGIDQAKIDETANDARRACRLYLESSSTGSSGSESGTMATDTLRLLGD